jgi:hypothetical protein
MGDHQPVRIPDGDIFGFMEHGADPAEQAVAEAQSCIGDPRSYERALEHERSRKPVVRQTGRPIMTLIAEALGSED